VTSWTHADTGGETEMVGGTTLYPVAGPTKSTLVAKRGPDYGLAERHILKNGVPSGSRIAQGLMSW
jgi:hypothetical protein